MGSHTTLHDTLRVEFCPPLDTSLLAALLAEVERDSDGHSQSPSSQEITDLRSTLTELAAQAERDEHQLSEDLKEIRLSSNSTTDETPDFFAGDMTTSSSSSDSSSSSQQSFSSPLGFLQAALPNVHTSKLARAITDAGGDNDDLDMESLIEQLLTSEFIRELEERGFDTGDLETASDGEQGDWETVRSKKNQRRDHTTQPAKARQRKNSSRGKTVAIIDIRQKQHARPARVNTTGNSAPDPWTQLLSLSTHLSSLLAPHPASYFQSFFHSPNYRTPSEALRACLKSISKSSSKNSDTDEIAASQSGLYGIIHTSSMYSVLNSEQRSRLMEDIDLTLLATNGRGEDALDLVWLLHDLDNDSTSGGLDMGIYHAPPPPCAPTAGSSSPATPTSPWFTQLPSGPPSLYFPKPIFKPPPGESSKQDIFAWQTVPQRKPSNDVHPLAEFIPAYNTDNHFASANTGGGGDVGKPRVPRSQAAQYKRRLQGNMQKRDELLREASRAWQGGNAKTRGGEVAMFYAERAREMQEEARLEALENAKAMVEATRLSSANHDVVDLHGTTVAEAIVIVKDILHRDGSSPNKPFKIITGRGTHSTNKVGVLKPAIKAALVNEGWDVGMWNGGLVIRGKMGRFSR